MPFFYNLKYLATGKVLAKSVSGLRVGGIAQFNFKYSKNDDIIFLELQHILGHFTQHVIWPIFLESEDRFLLSAWNGTVEKVNN